MMRIHFNKFERIAGLFVLTAILGFIVSLASVAIKQGWFEKKVYFVSDFENAEGVHPGTTVQMAGLKAGSVEDVELMQNNRIHVRFYVLSKFHNKIKVDSTAQLIRPFVIGERVLDIGVGSKEAIVLAADSVIKSHETIDLMTIMSGKKLGNYLGAISSMAENLKTLAEAFLNKDRTQSFIQMFDRIDPLLKNMNTMAVEVIKLSRQANRDENLGVVLSQLALTTKDLNKFLPEFAKQAPHLTKDVTELIQNMAILAKEFKVVLPALAAVAPDLPHTSRRAVEALDEAVVLIKAMQKSFMISGAVKDVREEEAKRKPAENHKSPLDSE